MSKQYDEPKLVDTSKDAPKAQQKVQKLSDDLAAKGVLPAPDSRDLIVAEQKERIDALEAMILQISADIKLKEDAGEVVEREAEVYRDPFLEDHNMLAFKCQIVAPDAAYPQGRMLKWCNPRLRGDIGMNGWNECTLGDAFLIGTENDDNGNPQEVPGGLLGEYLWAVPPRAEGTAKRDSYIRRTDLILCWIDMRLWVARSEKRTRSVARKRNMLGREDDNQIARHGASLVGPGLTQVHGPARAPSTPESVGPGLHTPGRSPIPVNPTPLPQE